MEPICDYCSKPAQLVTGVDIYPHLPKLYHKNFWNCTACEAYVGTHDGTTKPFGRLAKRDLRLAKSEAHRTFDLLWKHSLMSRKNAYSWLAEELGKLSKDCHIGMFDLGECREVVNVVNKYMDTLSGNPCGRSNPPHPW